MATTEQIGSRYRPWSSGLELHCYRLAVGSIHFEKLPRLEAEHAGQNVSRERLNLGVQVAHDGVVITAGVLNRVLSLTQGTLQLGEFLGSLQLRVILGHGEQALQRAGKLVLRGSLVRRRSRLHGLGTKLSDILKRAFFVGSVTLNCLHQIWDEVMTALELHIDVRPRRIAADTQLHQAVVHPNQCKSDDHQNAQNDPNHECLPFPKKWESKGRYHRDGARAIRGAAAKPCTSVVATCSTTIPWIRVVE